MNKVILMGRLTADPELRQTTQGTSVTNITLAVDRKYTKDGERQTDFIRCTAWRNTAEFIVKYFKKGQMAAVIGTIETRQWEDSEGKKQYGTDIVVDDVYFTGAKGETKEEPPKEINSFDDFSGGFDAGDFNLPFNN